MAAEASVTERIKALQQMMDILQPFGDEDRIRIINMAAEFLGLYVRSTKRHRREIGL